MSTAEIATPLNESTPYEEFVRCLFAPGHEARKNLRFGLADADAVEVLYFATLSGQVVDALKRNLYYGDKDAYRDRVSKEARRAYSVSPGEARGEGLDDLEDEELEILHACLGIFGEAAELLESIHARLTGGAPLDLENLVEEAGDTGFYLQALRSQLLSMGCPDPELENKKKLLVRYSSGRFSEEQARARADKGA